MLFPELKNTKFVEINLNNESVKFREKYPELFSGTKKNPFLNPEITKKLIDTIDAEYNLDWCYGGYLEDRSDLWAGSYLDKEKNYLHLGIDFNVPQGTLVSIDFDARILITDDDNDMDGGWGPRIILKPYTEPGNHVFLIYSHLQNIRCKQGDSLTRGQIIAEVGGPPFNGNWHPHLHVQAVEENFLADLITKDIYLLDGYGKDEEIGNLRDIFPDPIRFISLK